MSRKSRLLGSPLRLPLRWLFNFAGAIDQLCAAALGFNKDWTISAACGWLGYIDFGIWNIPIGKLLENALNFIVFPFTLLGYSLGLVETIRWHHCYDAFISDRHEHPYTIFMREWNCVSEKEDFHVS